MPFCFIFLASSSTLCGSFASKPFSIAILSISEPCGDLSMKLFPQKPFVQLSHYLKTWLGLEYLYTFLYRPVSGRTFCFLLPELPRNSFLRAILFLKLQQFGDFYLSGARLSLPYLRAGRYLNAGNQFPGPGPYSSLLRLPHSLCLLKRWK